MRLDRCSRLLLVLRVAVLLVDSLPRAIHLGIELIKVRDKSFIAPRQTFDRLNETVETLPVV